MMIVIKMIMMMIAILRIAIIVKIRMIKMIIIVIRITIYVLESKNDVNHVYIVLFYFIFTILDYSIIT